MGIAIDEPIGEDDLLRHYTDGAALLNIVNTAFCGPHRSST